MFNNLTIPERQILLNQLTIMGTLKNLTENSTDVQNLNSSIKLTYEVLGGKDFNAKKHYKDIMGDIM